MPQWMLDQFRHTEPRESANGIVQLRALDHTPELMANWKRGVDQLPLEMIAGADLDD